MAWSASTARLPLRRIAMANGLTLNAETRELSYAGRTVRLRRQAAIVAGVLMHADRAVSTPAMVDHLYGHMSDGGPVSADHIVRVMLCDLRQALFELGAPFGIVTTYTQGSELVWRPLRYTSVNAQRAGGTAQPGEGHGI